MEPRIWTPPLRDLSDEDASWGYDFVDFCAAIGWPLDLWQQWLAIHLGELLPDGSPRYRKAIILIARQNGKTVFTRLLILYWMFVERVPEILATSTDRAGAKRSWRKVVEMAERNALLAAALPARHTALQIGEEDFWNDHGAHYRFAAPTRRAGRGDTLHRAVLDELREHRTRDVWDAVLPAMNAAPDPLLVCISNEGDASSIVLHEEYDAAEEFALSGVGDPRTFLAAWSCPPGADPTDLEALAYANPSLGDRMPPEALLGQAIAATRAGGETLARFRIEIMCQRVTQLDPALDPDAWRAGGVPAAEALDLAQHRGMLALAFDVSIDATHATLVAAATIDGVTHAETIAAFDGFGCTARLRRELPGIVAKLRPRVLAYLPGGPAAAVAAAMTRDRAAGWPPRRTTIAEIRGEQTAVCMGLADVVHAGELRYVADDELLNSHVAQTQKLARGDAWIFARRGSEPIDATYALAAAVHEARQLRPRPSAVPD